MARGRPNRAGPRRTESGDQLHSDFKEGVSPSADVIGFDRVFELVPEAILISDGNRSYVAANRAACDLTGYSHQELKAMRMGDLTVPAEKQAATRHFAELAESGKSFRVATIVRKDGKELTVESHAIDLGNGLYMGCLRDLTEFRGVDAQLHDALQRLQFHVERMPLAYVVWDSSFQVQEWNPAAERIFGYAKDEAIGRHAYDLIVPEDLQATVDNIWDHIQQGDTSSHSINENVRKDGSRLTCEWFNTPLRNAAGEIIGACSMVMDVSEREDLEAQLRNAQALESLGVLAGGVAHDFNSALTVILGNASLLRSVAKLPNDAIGHLELIEEAGFRASELVKHLLAYARTGKHNPQSTNLNKVLQDVGEFLRASLGTGSHVTMELASELPCIDADHGQLEQLAMNLCLNAKEASMLGSEIHLQTKVARVSQKKAARCVPPYAASGNYVTLIVRDHGEGMAQETIDRVFDPFFTTKPDGHGLGLAAALGILRQHNAFALVESKLGTGTTIHIFFPISERGID